MKKWIAAVLIAAGAVGVVLYYRQYMKTEAPETTPEAEDEEEL